MYNTLTMTNDINQQIAAAFYFDHLPDAQKEEMLANVGEVIFKGVMIQALETLPEQHQNELGTLFDQNAEPEVVVNYLKAKLDNFEQIVVAEIESLKKEIDALLVDAKASTA